MNHINSELINVAVFKCEIENSFVKGLSDGKKGSYYTMAKSTMF